MQRWEYVGDGSAKFWEGEADGASVTLRFGRVGTTGQTQVKDFGTAEEARLYFAKAVATREKKGYAPVGESRVDAPPLDVAPPAAVRVDEDVFVFPTAWKRNVSPRRGGCRGRPPRRWRRRPRRSTAGSTRTPNA